MTTVHNPSSRHEPATGREPVASTSSTLPLRLLGGALTLGVLVIHVLDQGGFGALKDPAYIGYLYFLLELAAGLVIVGLLLPWARIHPPSWLLALGVAAGPIIGYTWSRGLGMPNYTEDKGNWTEPIGVASLVVEGLLVLLALTMLARDRRRV